MRALAMPLVETVSSRHVIRAKRGKGACANCERTYWIALSNESAVQCSVGESIAITKNIRHHHAVNFSWNIISLVLKAGIDRCPCR